MPFFFFIVLGFALGLLPSVIWLLFYLPEDVHPEPKRLVVKVFFWGMLAALPAIFLEGITKIFKGGFGPSLIFEICYWFLAVALVEELLKYLVVRGKILKDPEFDEPVDAMLYMVIAGLGFAASENILIFLSQVLSALDLRDVFVLLFFRFFSATFLHAVASATVGYFLALSFFAKKKRPSLVVLGLGISTLLHGFYDFSIIGLKEGFEASLPLTYLTEIALVILLGIAVWGLFVLFGFRKLRKMKT